MSQLITQEMTIPEILKQFPKTDQVFKEFGIRADGYKAIEFESLFATARVHQLDLDAVLTALNQAAASN